MKTWADDWREYRASIAQPARGNGERQREWRERNEPLPDRDNRADDADALWAYVWEPNTDSLLLDAGIFRMSQLAQLDLETDIWHLPRIGEGRMARIERALEWWRSGGLPWRCKSEEEYQHMTRNWGPATPKESEPKEGILLQLPTRKETEE